MTDPCVHDLKRRIRRRPERPDDPKLSHGTPSGYARGCGCDPCTDAATLRQRAYRARGRP